MLRPEACQVWDERALGRVTTIIKNMLAVLEVVPSIAECVCGEVPGGDSRLEFEPLMHLVATAQECGCSSVFPCEREVSFLVLGEGLIKWGGWLQSLHRGPCIPALTSALSSPPGPYADSTLSTQTRGSPCTESVASSGYNLTPTRWPSSAPRTQVPLASQPDGPCVR